MSESLYPESVERVVATIADICREQKRSEIVALLEQARAHFDVIDCDNWNGGTTTWALRLEAPAEVFASIDANVDKLEGEILRKIKFLCRLYPNDPLGEVTITPLLSSGSSNEPNTATSFNDERRLWADASCRLFLSHVSAHREHVGRLKSELREFGVVAFVAHEDIEPNLEWQSEISLALRSTHAIAALITSDFRDSKWTDQEIGWGLGRGIPVFPIQIGLMPYGFIGRVQAIPGSFGDVEGLAICIVKTLLRTPRTHLRIQGALVDAIERVSSVAAARSLTTLIVTIESFSNSERSRIIAACASNPCISQIPELVNRLHSAIGKSRSETPIDEPDIPF